MCEQFMGSSFSLQVSYSIVEDASYRISCETTQSKRHRCFIVIHIATPSSNTIMKNSSRPIGTIYLALLD